MNCLIEIEKERETKLKSAKIEDGFYNIIGGQRSGAARKLSVINPATGKELATVPDIVAASLDDAVEAFPVWHALSLARRKETLSAVEIDRHAEELSVLLTAEQGRPLFQARREIDLLTKLYGPGFMQMDIPEIEQEVTHMGHVFMKKTSIYMSARSLGVNPFTHAGVDDRADHLPRIEVVWEPELNLAHLVEAFHLCCAQS
jgi:Aldehyde dehydrogenase family